MTTAALAFPHLSREEALSETGGRRRLLAILAADVAGYSRLMTVDEDATVAALDVARNVCKAGIEGNQGRVIDMAGDSVLAVFETAIGAVSAALAIQKELESLANATPQDRRMRFRIGVHLGDVIEKADGTIYGDGVNIAARLQTLAEPGGVTVSGMVQETVRDRIAASFEDRGEHVVKNIARPVHVYRVDPGGQGGAAARRTLGTFVGPRRRSALRILTGAALLLAMAIGAWIAVADSAREARVWLASRAGMKSSQTLSARATIAVLPFANQSGDAGRDYFSDGITEDIINALGRFSGLMVMARNAVQTYKGRAVSPAEISRDLGVRYLVQGSVRQSDGTLRVAVELSDAEKGVLLWSERFDGTGQQVFEIQDQIVKNIVGTLAVKLTNLEQRRVFSKPTDSLEAYDLVLRARSPYNRIERTSNRQARDLLGQALKLAPNFAAAYVAMAEAEIQRVDLGWVEDPEESLKRGEALALKALAIDDPGAHAGAHGLLGHVYSLQGKNDQALAEANRALELNPSDAAAYASRGAVLLWLGRIDESIASTETALRFDPRLRSSVIFNLALGYYMTGRNRDAALAADRGLITSPGLFNLHVIRAMASAELGDTDGVRQAVDQVRLLSPFFRAETYGTRFANSADREKVQRGLRKAGW